MIIEKTFKSEITMTQWLAEPQNIEELKKKYSPEKYTANLNLIEKRVEVYEKLIKTEK